MFWKIGVSCKNTYFVRKSKYRAKFISCEIRNIVQNLFRAKKLMQKIRANYRAKICVKIEKKSCKSRAKRFTKLISCKKWYKKSFLFGFLPFLNHDCRFYKKWVFNIFWRISVPRKKGAIRAFNQPLHWFLRSTALTAAYDDRSENNL